MYKLLANSFYGRFALAQDNKDTTLNFAKDNEEQVKEFINIINDDTNQIVQIETDISNCYTVRFKDTVRPKYAKNTNVVIASFTTAYARVMLHRLMRHVGYENVLYCDTDSCIFKLKTDEKAR